MSEIGEKIRRAMTQLQDLGAHIAVCREGECQVYDITDSAYAVRVSVDPSSGLALKFTVGAVEDRWRLTYYVDTDLYDIKDGDQRWFVSEIEDDIVAVLEGLASGRIRIYKSIGKTVAVFPKVSGYVRVERGRLLTSQKHYDELSKAESGGEFQPLRL